LNNDVNLRADFSYRDDKTINYRLDQNIAEPTRGQKTISLAATIDYVINNKLNVRLFSTISEKQHRLPLHPIQPEHTEVD
jgi:cell surface protein SprA